MAVGPIFDVLGDGAPVNSSAVNIIPTRHIRAGAFFGDGTILMSSEFGGAMHYSSDMSRLGITRSLVSSADVVMVPHPDESVILLDIHGHTLYKFVSTGTALIEAASSSNNTECDTPSRAVVQQTGNQRIYVSCGLSHSLCQYDADLSNRVCTPLGTRAGLAIAPDGSFLIAHTSSLIKFTIDDAAGTLTQAATLNNVGPTYVSSLVVLSDFRIVVPDDDTDQLIVVDPDFTSSSTINVNDGSALGGITPGCRDPVEVLVDSTGTSDVLVMCDSSSDLVLVLSNDLSTTALELTPAVLGLDGDLSFVGTVGPTTVSMWSNVANMASSDKVFIGSDQSLFGYMILDLAGAGTAGLSGSYATPVLTPATAGVTYGSPVEAIVGGAAVVTMSVASAGAAVFGDGTVAIGLDADAQPYTSPRDSRLGHFSSDLTSLIGTSEIMEEVFPIPVSHPEGSVIVLEMQGDTVYKYTSTGDGLVQAASSSNSTQCSYLTAAVVQQTGNQRIFATCGLVLCQYDADLSNRVCTGGVQSSIQSIGIAPDDSFVVVRDVLFLYKYTIDDAAGTLTLVGSPLFIFSSANYLGVFSLVVLSDFRIVIPDATNDRLAVVALDFSTVSTINLNDGSTLGGITPACDFPAAVAADPSGTGDVVVACKDSETVFVISNDLTTTALEIDSHFAPGRRPWSLSPDLLSPGINLASQGGSPQLAMCDTGGCALFDLAGGGSAGLAGSYCSATAAIQDTLFAGTVVGSEGPLSRYPMVNSPVGVVDFGDGTMAVAMSGYSSISFFGEFPDEYFALLLSSTDFETAYDQVGSFVGHLSQMVAHPDRSAILLDFGGDAVYKYTASGSTLVQLATSSDDSQCNGPSRVVIQQTGSQRIFVMCTEAPSAVCQFDADLSNRTCTPVATPQGIGIAPDDSFLIARSSNTLVKYTIDDAAGTLAQTGSPLDISGSATSSAFSLVVLSDFRTVVPDVDNDQLIIIDAAFTSVLSTIDVNDGSVLGGISPECDGPLEIAVDVTGAGDVVVGCDGSDSVLVLSNDLETTAAEIDQRTLNAPVGQVLYFRAEKTTVGFVSESSFFVGFEFGFVVFGDLSTGPAPLPQCQPSQPQTQTQTQTQTMSESHTESVSQTQSPTQTQTQSETMSMSPPGSVGDPILVDFAGHRFMGGARGRSEYLVFASAAGDEAITMTTGVVQGEEGGFFAVAVSVQRAGCGALSVVAGVNGHHAEISGDTCMEARIARGDSGLTLVPIGADGEGVVLAVYPHQLGASPAFVNLKLLGTTAGFRAGCTGMLCDETHVDAMA